MRVWTAGAHAQLTARVRADVTHGLVLLRMRLWPKRALTPATLTRDLRTPGISPAGVRADQGWNSSAPSHLDLMWIDPGHTQVLRRLESFARTVIFDTRGVGLSDPLDHTPTVEEGADDLEAVLDAARVSALAGAGEVFVSRTVKDLVVGSGLEFEPRGTHDLKGVPGSWKLFALADARSPTVPVAAEQPPVRSSDRIVLAAARRAPGLLRLAGRFARS